eukprot:TRINITY_DN1171_c1_g1_i3.p1 TRINITY_DN1171_c1_g1~~TRINITY_DN1171_c1_g1_i3.p1  ORF type:complete len:389 (-),score=110.59 TRINITY_DN1171_c1_g1_i3:197-1363(-)
MLSRHSGTCPRCGQASLAEDHMMGRTVCTSPLCGSILEEGIVDETAEWRYFESDVGQDDKSRVGGPTSNFLSDGGLSTTIQRSKSTKGKPATLLQRSTLSDDDRHLLRVQEMFITWSNSMKLPTRVVERAKTIYKKIYEQEPSKTKKHPGMPAAVLYLAATEEQMPHSPKEVLAYTRMDHRRFQSALRFARKHFDDAEVPKPQHHMPRACPPLGLSHLQAACAHVAEHAVQVVHAHGRSPKTIAAASILFVIQFHDDNKERSRVTKSILANELHLSVATVVSAYKEFLPFWKKLIPPEGKSAFKLRSDYVAFLRGEGIAHDESPKVYELREKEETNAIKKDDGEVEMKSSSQLPLTGVKKERAEDDDIEVLRSTSDMRIFADTKRVKE